MREHRTSIRVLALALGLLSLVLAAGGAATQHEQHTSPYAGQQHSDIPSLSAEELEGLKSAAGMGLARAAELNHYPGPKHALELAAELGLSDGQRLEIEAIYARMHEAASELGERIIEAERMLNRRFAHSHIDETALEKMIGEIAALRGELRFVHLRAHLETKPVLSPEQVEAYDRLRGYSTPEGS